MNVISHLVGAGIEIDRSSTPPEAYGRPFAAAFFDGKDMSFFGVLYAIWVVKGARPGSQLTRTRTQSDMSSMGRC